MEKSSRTDGCIFLFLGYALSPFGHFESYLRIVVGLLEECIPSILKQYNSNLVTFEFLPGVYSIEDVSKAVYALGDHDGSLKIENDDICMKTKPI